MELVNLFYELARQHRRIKGFSYNSTRVKGNGKEAYPLVALDDPIFGTNDGALLTFRCNVDILGIPLNDSEVAVIQGDALNVGLSFAEKIRNMVRTSNVRLLNVSFLSLRGYDDNNSAGQRFTFGLSFVNPINRCADDYDPDKSITRPEDLPDFATDNPQGCAVFSEKTGLPNFKI